MVKQSTNLRHFFFSIMNKFIKQVYTISLWEFIQMFHKTTCIPNIHRSWKAHTTHLVHKIIFPHSLAACKLNSRINAKIKTTQKKDFIVCKKDDVGIFTSCTDFWTKQSQGPTHKQPVTSVLTLTKSSKLRHMNSRINCHVKKVNSESWLSLPGI